MNIQQTISRVILTFYLPVCGFIFINSASTGAPSILSKAPADHSNTHPIPSTSNALNLNEVDGYDHLSHVQRTMRKKLLFHISRDIPVGYKHNF